MKKLMMFVLAYFVLTMLWAYPWHVVWFHDLYAGWGAMTREHPIMEFGIAAIVIQGIVIAYLYPFYYRGEGNPIVQGIKFNLIIGLMTYSAMGFATAAKIQIEPASEFLLYHTVFQTVQFCLTGAVLGWIYRKKAT